MSSTERDLIKNTVMTLRIADDVHVCVPRDINLMTPYVLLEQEDWFEADIRFVRQLLEKGMSVIDIGANYGTYTLSMAHIVGDLGKVWAIDPSSLTMTFLRHSVAGNQFHNVTLIHAGLSDQIGRGWLPRETNTELGAIVTEATADRNGEEIELFTLDACEEHHGWHDISFVKMDAEGHESRILRGGKRFLTEQSPLMMYEIRAGSEINRALVDEFAALGYRSYRLVSGLGAGTLLPFDDKDEFLDPYTLNLYACKPDRAAALQARSLLCTDTVKDIPADARDADRWVAMIDAEPHTPGYRSVWMRHAVERDGQVSWPMYRRALNHYALSRTADLDMTTRAAHLKMAFDLLAELVREHANIARMLSLVRVATEWGQRGLAVRLLQDLVSILGRQPLPVATEPFLVPQPVGREPGGDLATWQARMIVESFIRLGAHSGYFAGDSNLPLLDALYRLGDMSPEMDRRRQLIRLRSGRQSCPEASAPLTQRSENNRNPEFWCSEGPGAG